MHYMLLEKKNHMDYSLKILSNGFHEILKNYRYATSDFSCFVIQEMACGMGF